jgi:putative tricarboxylic transport membrane protein
LSIVFLARTVVWKDLDLLRHSETENAETHWATPGLMLVALIAYIQLLERLGYALATTLFFLVAARILGSRDPVRDGVVGLVLGVVTAYAFTRWLGVRLPVGRWGV